MAVDALVLDGAPLSEDTLTLLKTYLPRISQDRFNFLELAVYVLTGELENPARAAALPGLSKLLSLDFSNFPDQIRKDILVDEFLLLAYRGDISGANQKLNTLLSAGPETADIGLQRMAAEFFYDHQNPLRAAELFSRFPGERDMARAADALVSAGEIPGARNIWLALSSDSAVNDPTGIFPVGVSLDIRSRSLYNLAASSGSRVEEAPWLEKLFSYRETSRQSPEDGVGIYSVIRYTRLLDAPQSIDVLEDFRQNHLLDLELLRRKLDNWPSNRAAAEVWLLLSRHEGDEALYEWAAWYFDHQKLYAETARLLKDAIRKGTGGPWLELHRSLALIREGKTAEGEKILKEASTYYADWRFYANLGRIQESRRAISAALESYETAAALVRGKTGAAQLYMRMSRCLEALGRTQESRQALEKALENDPDNIIIRREHRRLR
jgi:tetratricopeptide (TPR) repeat protein